MKLLKIVRFNDWKNYLVPFMLGIIFIQIYIDDISFNQATRLIILLSIVILGTAAYGYLMNNLYDLEEDRRAGKRNFAESMSGLAQTAFVLIFLIIALVPWLFLPVALLNFGLFILQLLLLTAYSIPPVRLKRFVHIGVITDALYNSVIMVFVIVFTIRNYVVYRPEYDSLILAVLWVMLFLKGLRGILLHQLADRKNDRKANVRTFVLHYGPLTTSNIINKVLLPSEFLTITILVILLSEYIPGLILLLLVFIFYKALKLRCWNIWAIIKWDYRFMFLYVLNDLYEEWIPLYALVLLTIRDITYAFVLIPYVLLFPAFFMKLYKDIPETISNFKGDFRRKFYGKYKQ